MEAASPQSYFDKLSMTAGYSGQPDLLRQAQDRLGKTEEGTPPSAGSGQAYKTDKRRR